MGELRIVAKEPSVLTLEAERITGARVDGRETNRFAMGPMKEPASRRWSLQSTKQKKWRCVNASGRRRHRTATVHTKRFDACVAMIVRWGFLVENAKYYDVHYAFALLK